jgi:predicted O-linked N-acetylglucosamine transferase (SPINDLY family)
VLTQKTRRSEYFNLGVNAEDAAGRINLYACPQSLFKFHPDFDEAVGRILAADPNGRLVIIHASSTSDELLQATVARMTAAIKAATVPGQVTAAGEIIVLPHQSLDDFLRLCGTVDVLLDTFPFGGGNTHYEALSTATPVITLRTRQMRGRITPALYHRLGLASPEHGLVARSIAEYVQMALRMASDRDANAVAREAVSSRVAGLYNDTVGIRELEQWLVNVSRPVTL